MILQLSLHHHRTVYIVLIVTKSQRMAGKFMLFSATMPNSEYYYRLVANSLEKTTVFTCTSDCLSENLCSF